MFQKRRKVTADGNAKLRQVALEKGLQELAAPRDRVGIGSRGERQRKSAAQPVPVLRRRAKVGEAEAFEEHDLEPAGERLGRLLEQLRRGAAENKEPRGSGLRSASTRSRGNSSGRRWTSSITTSPCSGRKVVSGWPNRARLCGSSRSK